MDKLKGAKYFMKLDLRSGYNNVQIKDSDQWKAAFKTSRGLFKPTVMFFRLCNSPATFQQMMDAIFQDEIHEAWVIIYMDNIFIFTRKLIINIRHTRKILKKLQDNDLFVKPEKCIFWQNKVEYLGMIIKENKIGMDPVKLRGIADWLLPKTVKDIQSFLGFRNHYRKFIDSYGDLTTLLNELLRKDKKFEWTLPWQLAFNTLKARFLEAPVLQMPDPLKPFMVKSDASKFASGAVL